MMIALVTWALFAAPTAPAVDPVSMILSKLKSGELYKVEVIGLPLDRESPFRIDAQSLRQAYTFKLEVRNIDDAECGSSFIQALKRVHLEPRAVQAGQDIRVLFSLSGNAGTAVSLLVTTTAELIAADWRGDASGLLDWIRNHAGQCAQ